MSLTPIRLELDTGPHIFGGYDGYVQSPIISGVEMPNFPVLTYKEYHPVGVTVTREIQLPRNMALRLGSFFLHWYTDTINTPMKGKPDCHSFAAYMMSTTDAPVPNSLSESFIPAEAENEPTPLADMQRYTPYGLFAWSGNIGDQVHSVIALPDGENISVRGLGSPLVLADTECMLHEYSAQTVHRIIRPTSYLS